MASQPTRPRLFPHHDSRSWTSTWYDDGHKRRTKRFGREGELTAKQAKARYQDWLETEWRRHEHIRNPDSPSAVFSVCQLRQKYLEYARTIYRKNGTETSTVLNIEYALDSLTDHHGHSPADSLTNPQLAKLRDAMIHDANGKSRSIKTVNGRLQAIQQTYKWAREKGYVSATTLADVLAVTRLRRGRSAANDPSEILPIDESVVMDTIAHCPPTVAAMIRLAWLTGMRPGEVCIMRPCDIEANGAVWLYRPSSHKLQHKDKDRVIPLGPQVQSIIKPFLTRDLSAYVFTPAQAQRERVEARHAARKTPLSCGNRPGTNRQESPQASPGDVYTVESFRKAIHHACNKAFDTDGTKRAAKDYSHHWNPNQLRHSWATRVRKDFGIEEASAGLGHSNLSTTQIYARRSLEKAVEVARKIG